LAQNRKFQDFVGNLYTDREQLKSLVLLYDFTVSGGAQGAIAFTDLDGNAATLPANAVVTNCVSDVLVPLTSAGSATLALGITGNTDAFIAATAFNNAAFVGVDSQNNEVPLKPATEVSVLATIATADLTGGKIRLIIQYHESVLA
jgi:hypothetical protein